MRRHLLEVEDVAALIRRGETLLLAGDESPLRRLPRGSWIAGTIPYFMCEQGGLVDRRRIFVEHLPPRFACDAIRQYGEDDIARVYTDLPPAGMGIMIAPNGSRVHLSFAVNAPRYERFATAPLFGWISGVHLSEIGEVAPKVFDGTSGEAFEDRAVVMDVVVPREQRVELGILNIFEKGDGPAIVFPTTGFAATTVAIDGRERNFAEYVAETKLDTRLPLVADYHGASVNVSFQAVDLARRQARFFAPVFAGVTYHHARPVPDCVNAFVSGLPAGIGERVAFSCNCVLNYVNCGLEGRRTGEMIGPFTFGEIAYQLLNQTMVHLTVSERGRAGAQRAVDGVAGA